MEKEYREYLTIIDPILNRSGSSVRIQLEGHFPGDRLAGGKYSMTTHTITLYIEEIREQCIQLFGTLDCFEEYLAVVFSHELGHAEDKNLSVLAYRLEASTNDSERSRIAFLIEKQAWNYAKNLLPGVNRSFMKKIIISSLEHYYQQIELLQGA